MKPRKSAGETIAKAGITALDAAPVEASPKNNTARDLAGPEHRDAATATRPAPKKKAARRSRRRAQKSRTALFGVGQVVRHKFYPFRGIVFDIDPTFSNTEEWWLSIPADLRPEKNQPFYHLLAENAETEYVAYVSEQNLLPDRSGEPLRHPKVQEMFYEDENGRFHPVFIQAH